MGLSSLSQGEILSVNLHDLEIQNHRFKRFSCYHNTRPNIKSHDSHASMQRSDRAREPKTQKPAITSKKQVIIKKCKAKNPSPKVKPDSNNDSIS
jgi:hypothetical protein